MVTTSEILEKTLKMRPVKSHELGYNSPTETLEPVYFWILNFMNNIFAGNVEKLTDNFVSSPGSGHFLEQSQRKTFLQEQVMKTLGGINQIIRQIINIVYDLKDFEIRLKHYEVSKSEDKKERETGLLALKQIWMDNVDIKKGQGSINGLAQGNLQFVTLRDAFMAANSVKDVDKIDLNERVKRILKPRLAEFEEWKKLSYQELKKRFNIEKNYLKSQVNTLKLYSKWIKPYLKAASQLEMTESKRPELVTVFNTLILELTLFAKMEVNVKNLVLDGKLPKGIKIPKRKYYAVLLVELDFVGIPQKPTSQHYSFGGKVKISFKGYTMNEDQIKLFEREMEKSDLTEVMKLMGGGTTESLDEIQKDVDYFLEDNNKNVEAKSKDINPFSALFSSLFTKKKSKEEKDKIIEIKKIKNDSYSESLVREVAEQNAEEFCYLLFDTYKKAHGMASHKNPY